MCAFPMKRRDALRLGGIAALAGTAGPALVACGGNGGTGDVSNKGKDLVPFPTYVPFDGPKPDLPGDDNGLQGAYLAYPKKIQPLGVDTPGDGSEVTASVISYGVPPKDVDTDSYAKAVHEALGVKLKLTIIPSANFVEKMSTMMTGDDIPDIIMFGAGNVVAQEQLFIQEKCADLSELIGGDAVKDFPALANIPPYAWKGLGRIGGKLYGVPIERPVFGGCMMVNRTAFDKVDAPLDWDKDSYIKAVSEATKKKVYGGGLSNDFKIDLWAGGLGSPNTWTLTDGKFTTAYTSDPYKEAIDVLAQLFKQKAIYPDSPNVPSTDMKTQYANGTVLSYRDGWGGMGPYAFHEAQGFSVEFGYPIGGDKATPWAGTGRFGYAVFKKADKKRVKMLLNICNMLAAPFGTKEFELFNYGVEDQHFTRGDGGNPVPTKLWESENKTNYPVAYIASAPIPLYYEGFPEETEKVYEWEKVVAPISIPDPSNGLSSNTWAEKGAQLEQLVSDAYRDVIFRGKNLSAFDDAMKKWAEDGGEAAAKEFEEEYAAANE